jgi:hypothetical protein
MHAITPLPAEMTTGIASQPGCLWRGIEDGFPI